MDKIIIKKLHIRANHGVFPAEKTLGQNFYLDIEADLNFYEASIEEDLTKSVHYGEMTEYIVEQFTKKKYDLIETAAIKLADSLLNKYPIISQVKLVVHKPEAPVAHSFEDIAVSSKRKRNQAFISLGSNKGTSSEYFDYAVDKLNLNPAVNVIHETKRITTKAYGLENQADFLNSIIEVETYLEAVDLLQLLNEIEKDCKRTREVHWGPRTLDLDILFYNQLIMSTKQLTLPHYDFHNRAFMLSQFCEINPHYVHPRLNKTIIELLTALGD